MKSLYRKIRDIPFSRSYLIAFVHAMLVVANGRFGYHTNGTQAFTMLVVIILTADEVVERMGGRQ